MFDLYLSELRRFWRFTLFAAIWHLFGLVWGHYHDVRVFGLSDNNQISLSTLYLAVPIVLAMSQLIPYFSPQRWLWLMHRPLPRRAIFGALALAASTQIVLVVALPLLVVALGVDFLTFHTVDLRHYAWIVFLAEVCVLAWLVLATMIFSLRWTSVVAFILPGILLSQRTTAPVAMFVAALTLALYLLIAYAYFKPDRKAPPIGLGTNIITALPLVIGNFVVLVVILVLAYSASLKLVVDKPAQKRPASNSFKAAAGMESAYRMKFLVAKSTDPRRLAWADELETAPVYSVLPNIHGFPKRQQLFSKYAPRPYVAPNRILWSFDHDEMRFTGLHADTGEFQEARGLHGKDDLTPFPAIPYVGMDYLVTPQQVYAFDAHTMQYPLRAILQAPDFVESEPKRIGQRFYMRSNQRLISYHPDRLGPEGLMIELFNIALPEQSARTAWIDVAPLDGTTLITMSSYSKKDPGISEYMLQLYSIDHYDQVTLLTELRQPVPKKDAMNVRDVGWILSPLLHAASNAIAPVLSGRSLQQTWEHATGNLMPLTRWIALAALMLSGLAAWLWLRKGPQRTAWGWSTACIVLGLPALATVMVLYPRQRLLVKH